MFHLLLHLYIGGRRQNNETEDKKLVKEPTPDDDGTEVEN